MNETKFFFVLSWFDLITDDIVKDYITKNFTKVTVIPRDKESLVNV